MIRKYSALDLFGGKEVVFERMELLARDKLNLIPRKDFIYEELRSSKNSQKFIDFLDGKRKIDFRIFDMLRNSYLEMNIDEVLGNHCFRNNEERKYWLNQIKENPMVIGGTRPSKSISKETELRFYIRRIAVSELYQAA